MSCLTSSCSLAMSGARMTQLAMPWPESICFPVPKSGPVMTCVSVCVCFSVWLCSMKRISKKGGL